MNWERGAATTTATVNTLNSSSNNNNSNGIPNHTTGSRKRKRGLAPRKTQSPQSPSAAALSKKAAAATTAAPAEAASPATTSPPRPLHNGHHTATTKARPKVKPFVAAAVAEMREEPLCSMCGKEHPHPLVDMRANVLMKHTLTFCCMVPTQNLERTLAAICVQCVYKINAIKDVTNTLKIRLRRLTNGQIRSAATVIETSPNAEEREEEDVTMATVDKSPETPEVKEAQKLEEEVEKEVEKMEEEKKNDEAEKKIDDEEKNNEEGEKKKEEGVKKKEEGVKNKEEGVKKKEEGPKRKRVHKEEALEPTSAAMLAAAKREEAAASKSPKKFINKTETSSPKNCRTLTEMLAEKATITLSVKPTSNAAMQSEVVGATAATAIAVTPEILPPLPPLLCSPGAHTSAASSAHNNSNASSTELLDRSITPPPYSPLQPREQQQTPPREAPTEATAISPVESLKAQKTQSGELKEKIVRIVAAKETTPTQPSPPSTPSSLNAPETTQETVNADDNAAAAAAAAGAVTAAETSNVNHSMLEVFCERSESALITESGGTINNYGRRNGGGGNSRRQPPAQLNCAHCTRVYWRKDHYAKHVRRCGAQHRRAKSLGALPKVGGEQEAVASVQLNATLTAEGVEDAAKSTTTSTTTTTPAMQQRRRSFHCGVCAVTVDKIAKLREHKRIHMQRYYCDNCSGEFTTLYAYDFHRVACISQQEISSDTIEPRVTRARSRAPTQVNVENRTRSKRKSSVRSVGDKATEMEALPQQKVDDVVGKACESVPDAVADYDDVCVDGDDDVDNVDNDVDVDAAECNTENDDDDDEEDDVDAEDDDEEEEDDEDDDVTIDTMYTKRMRFTSDWVANQHDGLRDFSLCDNTFCDYDEDNQFSTYREYDLYLLERLNLQVKLNSFSCFTCEAANEICTATSLPLMMLHDYVKHSRAFFYCKKCGGCFTSKVFLDYHLERQNFGVYKCNKCEDYFEFQQQLQRHLIRHTKCVNYRCNECRLEFLTESRLLQHCSDKQHNPNCDSEYNDQQPAIRIDRTMTLTNNDAAPPPDEVPRRRRGYSVRILDWRLPRMPSKRPLQLSPNFRRKIGQVDFAGEEYPNCQAA